MATPSIAANAYASLSRLTDPSSGGGLKSAGAGTGPEGASFGTLLKDAVDSLTKASRAADMQSQSMVTGKANIVDVVTAVAETEVAIDALVSVRDKVINAYDEIMKMPI